MGNGEKKRLTVGVMFGDVKSDYSVDVLNGLFSAAKEEDVDIVFLTGPHIPQYCLDILSYNLEGDYYYQFDTVYDYVRFLDIDVLIVATGPISHCYPNYDRKSFLEKYAKVPYILIQDVSDEDDVCFMAHDNYGGMRACMEHLVKDHGYRHVAFLGGPLVNRDARDRLAAYRDVMEENGIVVEDRMIAYGDYTELVEDLVVRLLEDNPEIEAIACANDNMAQGCYNVCKKRGLVVGKDIAITGFDDVDLAKKMQPPLTTVNQKSRKFSYAALRNAIALCRGEETRSEKMSTLLVKRASCGCIDGEHQVARIQKNLEEYIDRETDEIAAELLLDEPREKYVQYYTSLIKEYFQYIYRTVLKESSENFDMDKLLGILHEIIAFPNISKRVLVRRFLALLQGLSSRAVMSARKQLVLSIYGVTQRYIYTSISTEMEEENMELNRKGWFVANFVRDLNYRGTKDDLSEVMYSVMERFKLMDIKSCYIYLFKESVDNKERLSFETPKTMYLTAYYNSKEMVCYPNKERPYITIKKKFSPAGKSDGHTLMTGFILFSGEKQYGIMFCEIEQKDASFLQMCGMQLGTLLRYIELDCAEKESYEKLQKSLKVIREQNHLLSFVSEYDEMCQILNRRGFMERANAACKQNDGRKAYLLFADLDHLKEINDKFGHVAGDFAIKSVADRLCKVFPQEAIVARLGGDEFIVLAFSEMPGFREAILSRLKEESKIFNANEDIPYYVEFSIGIYGFNCEAEMDLNELMKKSDELLYESKRNRRASICK